MSKSKIFYRWAFLLILLFVIIAGVAEFGYRVQLHNDLINEELSKITEEPRPTFRFFGYPHTPWQFDPDEGWVYTDTWISGIVTDGAFDQFKVEHPINEYGTIGEITTSYEEADIKILVFASSYTPAEVTNVFQDRLSERLGKRVCALTFTKGSTGVLAFMDMARVRAEKYKPDMILIAFSTTCFRINRRAYVNHPSREHFWRFYQSVIYSDNVHPKTHVVHNTKPRSTVITDLVTEEWGQAMLAAKESGDEKRLHDDPVIQAMIEEYNEIQKEDATPLISEDFCNGWQSYLLNKWIHGDPFRGETVIENKFTGGDLGVKTNVYPTDTNFLKACQYLKENGYSVHWIHIPNLPEASAGTGIDYKSIGGGPKPWDDTIEKSVEEVTGSQIYHLAEYYEPDAIAEPLQLFAGERNWHPSEAGLSAQADALVNLYTKHFHEKGNNDAPNN